MIPYHPDTVRQMTDRVVALANERLGLRAKDIATVSSKAARRVPRPVSAALSELAETMARVEHPKLQGKMEAERVARSYDLAVRYLTSVDARARRRQAFLRWAGALTLRLLVIVAVLGVIVYWRTGS
ncbi:MAG: hypothetical protein D6688_07985 [Alphaproteobacteria bacterium]|nr:MAG: hypothetical protein D6688_07985 [Alphaproteobacteria bacterium]